MIHLANICTSYSAIAVFKSLHYLILRPSLKLHHTCLIIHTTTCIYSSYMHLQMHASTHTRIYICIHVHVSVHLHASIHNYACMLPCVYIHLCTMYMHIIHRPTYTSLHTCIYNTYMHIYRSIDPRAHTLYLQIHTSVQLCIYNTHIHTGTYIYASIIHTCTYKIHIAKPIFASMCTTGLRVQVQNFVHCHPQLRRSPSDHSSGSYTDLIYCSLATYMYTCIFVKSRLIIVCANIIMFQTKFHASLEELVIEITEEEESRRSSKSSSSGRGGGRITRRRRKKNADGFSSVGNIKNMSKKKYWKKEKSNLN